MRYILLIILAPLLFSSMKEEPVQAYHLQGEAQGTTYHITYYAADSVFTSAQADSIFNSLDSSLSWYKSYSLITAFNRAKDSFTIDEHLQNVVTRALQLYVRTQGTFDITVYPLVTAWGFGLRKVKDPPDSAHILRLMPCIGSDKLKLEGYKLSKLSPCIQIDLNGIGQGYSLDVITAFMESRGIKNYLAELGGEMKLSGYKQPGNIKMKIGIESPARSYEDPAVIRKIIAPGEGAITTSGNYRNYYERNGLQINHLLNPLTGFFVRNELISVTVWAKDAMTADAYDNALMVMGLQRGLHFAEAQEDIEAYFIYRTPTGAVSDTATRGFYTIMQN